MLELTVAFACSIRDIRDEGASQEPLLCFVDIAHHKLFEDAKSIPQGKNLSLKQVWMKTSMPSRK